MTVKVPPPPMERASEGAMARAVAALAPLVGAEASVKHLWWSKAVLFERGASRALICVSDRRWHDAATERLAAEAAAVVAGTWVRGEGQLARPEMLRALGDVLAVPREETAAAVNALAASDGAAVARRRRAQAAVDAHAENFARDAVAALARGIDERQPSAVPRGVRWERDVESRVPALIAADDGFDWACVPERLRADPDGGVLQARLDRAAADAFASAGTDGGPQRLHQAAYDALQGAPLIAGLRQSEVARRAVRGGVRISSHDVSAAGSAMTIPGFWFGAGAEVRDARAGVDTAAGERGIWATKAAREMALTALVAVAVRGVAIDDREAFAALVLATQPAGAAPRGALLADESAWSVVSEAQRLLGGALRADGKLAWHAVSGPAALEPLRGVAEALEAAQRGCAAACVDPRGLADWFAA